MTLPIPDWVQEEWVERERKAQKELIEKYDWWHYMKPVRRFLLKLATRFVKYPEAYASSIDDHCFIECVCGHNFSICSGWIEWCPKCGRGYSTDFIVHCYPPILKRKTKEV